MFIALSVSEVLTSSSWWWRSMFWQRIHWRDLWGWPACWSRHKGSPRLFTNTSASGLPSAFLPDQLFWQGWWQWERRDGWSLLLL